MDFLIQYKIKPDLVDDQLAAIKAFTDAIRADGDAGVRYTAYREEDGVSFCHHAWMADQDTFARFQGTPHFKIFAEGMAGRWQAPPTVTKLAQYASSAD
jgi:quinol monooxygenase YgiN